MTQLDTNAVDLDGVRAHLGQAPHLKILGEAGTTGFIRG